jgi:nitrous oxide reductase accessory protein NosL
MEASPFALQEDLEKIAKKNGGERVEFVADTVL